ncbi:hypothetical protein V0R50_19280 [Pseudomonas sp. 148P]|uniref:Uncharacterized protein n=1 Tax=Pseudomonas ulcerans TaxID=3115852 RepID=A0ABU7HV28_9PSED|nr:MULTISPECIES: hypothetical protein [unclassified Pseudomonas]MEE1923555.1 hypothetical protein [Pseudomonas sp. 147P]MEE1935378.1 hypothetical protein [Pseudomonas sp. 148P]
MASMLIRLLNKGDEVSIDVGRLAIRPKSKKVVPKEWLDEHSEEIIKDILSVLEIDAYQYYDYGADYYGPKRSPGVTLHFRSVVKRTHAYVIYNADLSRSRNTVTGQKGGRLPPGQFRIKNQRWGFHKFWERSGLKFPPRLSSFHDYMGNLKGILFIADGSDSGSERLDKKTLRPLSVTAEEIERALLADNSLTMSSQKADSFRTNLPDKEFAPGHGKQGSQARLNTCSSPHGKAVNRSRGVVHHFPTQETPPKFQENEEWLERCFGKT